MTIVNSAAKSILVHVVWKTYLMYFLLGIYLLGGGVCIYSHSVTAK